jgi:hypothetical protein
MKFSRHSVIFNQVLSTGFPLIYGDSSADAVQCSSFGSCGKQHLQPFMEVEIPSF